MPDPDYSAMSDDELLALKYGAMSDEELLAEKSGQPAPSVPAAAPGFLEQASDAYDAPARWQGAAQGITLGFGEELSALGATGLQSASEFLGVTDPAEPRAAARGLGAPLDERSEYEINRDLMRGDIAAAQQRSPGAYMAGEVGGALMTAPLTGGGAGAATRLGRFGRAVGEGVAVGAAEGAGRSEADLLGGEVGQFLGDTAAGAGIGAAVPTAMAGAGAVGRGLVRGVKGIPGVAQRMLGTTEKELGKTSADLYAPSLSAGAERTAREVTMQGPEGAAARELIDVGPQELDIASRELSKNIAATKNASEHVIQSLGINKKPVAFQQAFQASPPPVPIRDIGTDARLQLTDIRDELKQLYSRFNIYKSGTGGQLERMGKPLTEFMMDFDRGIAEGGVEGVTQAYIALDRTKRMLGQAQGAARDTTIKKILRARYETSREYLERPDIWGQAVSAKQVRMNDAWTKKITADDAGYGRTFIAESPTERSMVDRFEPGYVARTDAVDSWAKSAGTPAADRTTEIMRAGADAEANLARVLSEEFGAAVEPQVIQWGQDATAAAKKVGELTEQSVQRGEAGRRFGYLQEELRGVTEAGGTVRQRLGGRVGIPTPSVAARQMTFAESQRDLIGNAVQKQTLTPAARESARRILQAWQTPGIAGAVEFYKQMSTNEELREAAEEEENYGYPSR